MLSESISYGSFEENLSIAHDRTMNYCEAATN